MSVSQLADLLQRLHDWTFHPRAMLVYVDLRHMRNINRIGYPQAGDRVIRRTLATLERWAGADGLAYRLWSNEFVAAKPVDSGESAIDAAAALRRQLTRIDYASPLGRNPLTVAIGLVVVGAGCDDWHSQLRAAAEACEVAKRRGLNQIVSLHRPEPGIGDAEIDARHVLQFRRLRDEQRLELCAQPIMDIRGPAPRLAKAEFLTRMREGNDLQPLPAGMIRTLEHFGLSTEIDRCSVQGLLDWLDRSPQVLHALDGVSLNLSARSLVDGRFMEELYEEVRRLHLAPGKLGFEITETAAIDHLGMAAALVADFAAIGCSFSLDDFGSGLCSFAYLQSLPVAEVKIDGRFIRELADDPVALEIIRAIHQVAKATGKRSVAEFVDDPHKLAVLKSLGVDYAQGWLFHPALPREDFLRLIERAAVA